VLVLMPLENMVRWRYIDYESDSVVDSDNEDDQIDDYLHS